MSRPVSIAIFVLAIVVTVVLVDVVFFRDHFWLRLIANIGIVLVFAAFGSRFLQHRS
jgi:hypothetical protein